VNIYVAVEGVAEKKVYAKWIPLVNPSLSHARVITDVDVNRYFIVSGGGYPGYFETIEDAIEDLRSLPQFNRLVIAIDSENMSADDKRREVVEFVEAYGPPPDYRVVVQHFCLETWGLGNRRIVSRQPENADLRLCLAMFDVSVEDPELLPALPSESLNRAQFAEKYLRLLFQEKFSGLGYSKNNPRALSHNTYFRRVRERLEDTGHIASFDSFLGAFA